MEKYKIINNEYNEENKNSGKLIPIKLLIFALIFLITLNNSPESYKNNDLKRLLLEKRILVPNNKYNISKYFNDTGVEYFNITKIKYTFSYKFKQVKVEYNVVFYDKNDKIMAPSNLSLYNNLHLICHIEVKDPDTTIDSLGYNHQNKYYICVEFFNINEKIKFGVKLYRQFFDEHISDEIFIKFSTIYLFTQEIFEVNNIAYEDDNIFDPFIINKNFEDFVNDLSNSYRANKLKMKKYYMEYPNSILKRYSIIEYNKWTFKNIYNHHFCACNGFNCLDKNIGGYCKFNFYLYILDNNRNLYKKTDYLFVDLYFKELVPEDTYPVFEKMAKLKYPVHYITEREDIYNEYCPYGKQYCLDIIKVDRNNYTLNGDFFENYLELFLKLKAVVSARVVRSLINVFSITDYITYIYTGNGLYYFKQFVYMDFKLFEPKIFDKILLPNSDKFISLVKSKGWTDEEIIKINLPRWEKYYKENNKEIITNKNILIYFNPRDINKEKSLSELYMDNIKSLITNINLNNILIKNNVTVNLAFYYSYVGRKNKIKKLLVNNTNIKVIEHYQIPEYLKTANLLVSDYSTIILDMLYLGKPIILYVPDIEEANLTDIYKPECSNVIESLRNSSIEFENLCFNINETVDKINFYINNNFKLDEKLKNFYDSFGFKNEKGIDKFIKYLKNLKQ